MKIEIDAYEKLGKEADKRHAEKLWVSGHYHFMLEVRESLKEKNGFIHTLARDLVVLQEHEDYYYATLCMNAMPHLINELRAARKAISYAQSLLSEDDAFNAVSHFNVAFELRNALKEYEETVK